MIRRLVQLYLRRFTWKLVEKGKKKTTLNTSLVRLPPEAVKIDQQNLKVFV